MRSGVQTKPPLFEISNELSPAYRQIAFGLREIKQTAIDVSQCANTLLHDVLLTIEKEYSLDEEQTRLFFDLKNHCEMIASTPDPWIDITAVKLASAEAIEALIQGVLAKLKNHKENKIWADRLASYTWFTWQSKRLQKLFLDLNLSSELNNVINLNLYAPMQRMTKLQDLLKKFQENLSSDAGASAAALRHVKEMQTEVGNLTRVIDRHIPEEQEMTVAANLMLTELSLFSPKIAAPLYELDLDDLERTINSIDNNKEFKLQLARLLLLIKAEIQNYKFMQTPDEKIANCRVMNLCRDTQHMLNELLKVERGTPERIFKRKLKVISAYKKHAEDPSLPIYFLKVIGAILLTALVTVAVAAVFAGFYAALGTLLAGPAGTVVGGVTGLVKGSLICNSLIAGGLSTAFGLPGGAWISHLSIFKPDPLIAAAVDVARALKDDQASLRYKSMRPAPARAPSLEI